MSPYHPVSPAELRDIEQKWKHGRGLVRVTIMRLIATINQRRLHLHRFTMWNASALQWECRCGSTLPEEAFAAYELDAMSDLRQQLDQANRQIEKLRGRITELRKAMTHKTDVH